MSQFLFSFFFFLTSISHINSSLLLLCLFFLHSVLLPAVLGDNIVVQTGCTIAKFPKFKDNFFLHFDFFKTKIG